jgi:hypothetical protein
MTDFGRIRVVTEPTRERLNERQLVDNRAQSEDCIEWLLDVGKNPAKEDWDARTIEQ